MDNDELEKRQNELVQFLATRKDLPEYNIKTVNEMIRRLAKYEHDLNAANKKNRDFEAMVADDRSFGRKRDRYPNEPGYPQVIELPVGTRSVEIKL